MAFCEKCSTSEQIMDFPSARALSEHIKSNHKTRPEGWAPRQKRITLADMEKNSPQPNTPDASSKVAPEAKPVPIELQYRFVGQCPMCLTEVDTIMMEVGKGLHAVAYCVSCKKKLADKKVVALT